MGEGSKTDLSEVRKGAPQEAVLLAIVANGSPKDAFFRPHCPLGEAAKKSNPLCSEGALSAELCPPWSGTLLLITET